MKSSLELNCASSSSSFKGPRGSLTDSSGEEKRGGRGGLGLLLRAACHGVRVQGGERGRSSPRRVEVRVVH